MSVRHTYEYDIDLNSDVAPARVLRMVQPGSRVLEIGAGPGSVTRHLSGTLGCSVVALEIDPAAIEKLRPFADRVFASNLNDPDWAEIVLGHEGKFDFVIAADVLEHVYSPWDVLGGMKSLLNDTGSVILSLPHVGHAAIAGCLVDEDFEYRDWGLLDRTHIRFFGIKNVQELYRSQGLAIEQAEFVVRTPEMTEFVRRWKRLPKEVQEALQRNSFSHVYQVVSRAVPVERSEVGLSLMDLTVPPPDQKDVDLWKGWMAAVAATAGSDLRSTIPPVPATRDADFDVPEPQDSALASKIVVHETQAALTEPDQAAKDVRLIAFYLTQFHPVPQNDHWWGKGFTEWTNVTKSVPLFKGHYQPHLPTDLGFYDLRLRETRHEQIAMAKSYGVDGFCYYYYWFSGERLLERPLDDMLADPESDMPFCLCWANENWTRRWDAAEHEILIAQEYRHDDDLEFIKSLVPFITDPRYIRIDGAPLIIVYRPQHLPDSRRSIAIWRDYCASIGIPELHLACALTHGNWDHAAYGFDSGVEFPPHNMKSPNMAEHLEFSSPFEGYVPDYREVAEMYLANSYSPEWRGFRGVFPSWDNTARRGSLGTPILNGTPENYEYWLSQALSRTRAEFPGQESLVFVNAWNEWAEGCHLEPDRRYGHRFLESTARALAGDSTLSDWTHVGIPKECEPDIETARVEEVSVAAPVASGDSSVSLTHDSPPEPRKKSPLSRNFRKLRQFLRGKP